jgi:DNA-binding MarR family transcriptional regulator
MAKSKSLYARRFTYGDQFDEAKTPLRELLTLCQEHTGSRDDFQEAIREAYFPGHGNADNSKKMAMNCVLSLHAYLLIQLDDDRKFYSLTALAHDLIETVDNVEMFKKFAIHIVSILDGLVLLRLIENIRMRGEQVTLEYIGEELNELGIKIPPNSTYVSTMRSWLAQANVFRPNGYEINWDVVYDLLYMDADAINRLYDLVPEQKYFLLSLVSLNATEFMPSNQAAKHARSVYSIRLTSKNLVTDIIKPLESRGFLESRKTTTGRGGKPHNVRLTAQGRHDLLAPLLESLVQLTDLHSADLNRTFEHVIVDLKHKNKHVRGIALELFAIWIVRLLGLRFSKWRLRHFQATGNAEVDVMAASDKIVYNRWQIQCKNIRGKIDVDTVAKEVGLTFLTKADVVMLVTTGGFTSDAVNYANQVMESTRYYIILLDGNDLERIKEDRSRIVDILNVKARRIFARKELGITEFGDEFADEVSEEQIGEEIAEAAESLFADPDETITEFGDPPSE